MPGNRERDLIPRNTASDRVRENERQSGSDRNNRFDSNVIGRNMSSFSSPEREASSRHEEHAPTTRLDIGRSLTSSPYGRSLTSMRADSSAHRDTSSIPTNIQSDYGRTATPARAESPVYEEETNVVNIHSYLNRPLTSSASDGGPMQADVRQQSGHDQPSTVDRPWAELSGRSIAGPVSDSTVVLQQNENSSLRRQADTQWRANGRLGGVGARDAIYEGLRIQRIDQRSHQLMEDGFIPALTDTERTTIEQSQIGDGANAEQAAIAESFNHRPAPTDQTRRIAEEIVDAEEAWENKREAAKKNEEPEPSNRELLKTIDDIIEKHTGTRPAPRYEEQKSDE